MSLLLTGLLGVLALLSGVVSGMALWRFGPVVAVLGGWTIAGLIPLATILWLIRQGSRARSLQSSSHVWQSTQPAPVEGAGDHARDPEPEMELHN